MPNEEFYYTKSDTSWGGVCTRVAGLMPVPLQEEVRDAIYNKLFLPGTPILRNANAQGSLNMLSCHNIQVGNSVEKIWEAAQHTALILKAGGGGVGLEFSKLSPRGTPLKYIAKSHETHASAAASGPVSFLKLFILTGELIGTARSGKPSGMMCLLRVDHGDVKEWIAAKDNDGVYHLCNMSVSLDEGPDSVNPDTWKSIIYQAWKNGTPGIVFLDNVNRGNQVLDEYGPIETQNVCAENPAYSYEGCALSSIVLPNVIKKLGCWEELKRAARLQALLLNRVVDLNHYPLPQFREMAHDLRRIGNGVMGFHTLLKREGIPLYSEEANALGRQIASIVYLVADKTSWELAEVEGGYRDGRRRNVSLMAIAPNGHGSRLGECTPSIYCDLYNPDDYKAHLEATPEQHINHIKAWQDVVDGGVSYTVSVPFDSKPSRVDEIFRRAHSEGLKAISVYRDGSRKGQPCTTTGACNI